MRDAVRAAIVRAAQEDGIDPAFALAVAERESAFNPTARSSRTIRGIYQMRGDLREKYGVGDSDDPYHQAKGWGRFLPDVKRDMASVLGRDPSDAESYLGHHFGARRAARLLKMAPDTPVGDVFTPGEMAINPHFGKAGTVGALNSSVMADIARRSAKFGGAGVAAGGATQHPADSTPSASSADLSSFGEPVTFPQRMRPPSAGDTDPEIGPDLSSFGDVAYRPSGGSRMFAGIPTMQERAEAPDLSSFGEAVLRPSPRPAEGPSGLY